jgi:zinc transporter 1/2/3
MNLLLAKIGAIVVILIESIAFALFPVYNKKFKSNKKLMGLANSFSAGIFIAAGILHVLPDANEAYDDAMSKKVKPGTEYFPWPNLCAILSFSLVFLVDKVIFDPH